MYLVSRTTSFAKLFFIVSLIGLLMYNALAFYTFHQSHRTGVTKPSIFQSKPINIRPLPVFENPESDSMKYILLWTTPEFEFKFDKEGQKLLIDNDCSHLNCFITTNKSFLGDVSKFDAIVFSISTMKRWKRFMPKSRSPKQKYVFYATIPANENPVCNIKADEFFNWTWTYKLHSDIPTPFLEVKDMNDQVIAPSLAVDWPAYNNSNVSSEYPNKRKAVVWHDEFCNSDHAKSFAKSLQKHLLEHGVELDVYNCDTKCPKEGCSSVIKKVYFYLAFEKSISDDYMTKEVLKGYDNDAVPIVIGGADYTKFLPPGSYIDARYDSPERLASLLGYIARNPLTYNKYFSYKQHYTITGANLQKGYCSLCSLLNDKRKVKAHTWYESIRKWWYAGNLHERCYPKGAETFDEVLSYIDNPTVRKNYMP